MDQRSRYGRVDVGMVARSRSEGFVAAGDGPGRGAMVRWLAAAGVIGTVLFFALILIIGATRESYSLLSDEISQLSASGVAGAWAQTANFIIFGLIVVGLAVGLHLGITDGEGSVIGPILIGLFGGLAAFGNGVFPTDQYGAPETTIGDLHSLTAGIGFVAVLVAMFVLPRRLRQDPEWSDLAGISRWMGVGATALMVLYLFASEVEGFLDGYVGLIQRIFAAVVLIWLFILSLRLYQISTRATRATSHAVAPEA